MIKSICFKDDFASSIILHIYYSHQNKFAFKIQIAYKNVVLFSLRKVLNENNNNVISWTTTTANWERQMLKIKKTTKETAIKFL